MAEATARDDGVVDWQFQEFFDFVSLPDHAPHLVGEEQITAS